MVYTEHFRFGFHQPILHRIPGRMSSAECIELLLCHNARERYVPVFSGNLFHFLALVSHADEQRCADFAVLEESEAAVVETATHAETVAMHVKSDQRYHHHIQ